MKRILFDISSLLIAVITVSMFIACSSDDNLDNTRREDSKQQLTFTLTGEDFNADEEISVTRAGKQSLEVAKDTIDLGNDIFAETTLERDTARDAKPATRAAGMSNGTYTILAYQSGVLKGTLKGTVTSNVFTATSANQSLSLDPGTYTFYCCNDKVNISGNNLTVNRADAGTARIGVTTKVITATPAKQKVDFVMKYVGARVRIKISGYMPFNAQGRLLTNNTVPGTITLDATSGSFITDNSIAANTNLQSTLSPSYPATESSDLSYNITQADYVYILPGTYMNNLSINIPSVYIYKKTMSNITLKASTLYFNAIQNSSYVLKVTLKYNYKVLYEDGTTGFLGDPLSKKTGHGSIMGLVIKDNNGSINSGTAMVVGGGFFRDQFPISMMPSNPTNNTTQYLYPEDARNNDRQGYHWSWDASGSNDGKVKAEDGNNLFGRVAGGYIAPSIPLGSNISKLYIPALGELMDAYEKVSFGDGMTGVGEAYAHGYTNYYEKTFGTLLNDYVTSSYTGAGMGGWFTVSFYNNRKNAQAISPWDTVRYPTLVGVIPFVHF